MLIVAIWASEILISGRIQIGIDAAFDVQACPGCRARDRLDDGATADQRLSPPVLRDERELTVFDLVPFAGAQGQVANRDRQTEFVGEISQFPLPQPDPDPVAASAIRGDHQGFRIRITGPAHFQPPEADRIDRETGRVVVDADTDPARVTRDVVNPVWRRPARFRDFEIVHPDVLGLAFRAQFAARVLEVANQLLLFGIHRNRRAAFRQNGFHLGIDVTELRVPVRVMRSFLRLPVRLQTVIQPT